MVDAFPERRQALPSAGPARRRSGDRPQQGRAQRARRPWPTSTRSSSSRPPTSPAPRRCRSPKPALPPTASPTRSSAPMTTWPSAPWRPARRAASPTSRSTASTRCRKRWWPCATASWPAPSSSSPASSRAPRSASPWPIAKDKTEPKEKLVLLTPIVISKDNLDKAERIGEAELTPPAGSAGLARPAAGLAGPSAYAPESSQGRRSTQLIAAAADHADAAATARSGRHHQAFCRRDGAQRRVARRAPRRDPRPARRERRRQVDAAKILSGVMPPSSGRIVFDGAEYQPRQSRRMPSGSASSPSTRNSA